MKPLDELSLPDSFFWSTIWESVHLSPLRKDAVKTRQNPSASNWVSSKVNKSRPTAMKITTNMRQHLYKRKKERFQSVINLYRLKSLKIIHLVWYYKILLATITNSYTKTNSDDKVVFSMNILNYSYTTDGSHTFYSNKLM